jgi:hypothetical protein
LLPLTKRLKAAKLEFSELAFLTNISEDRIKEYARGRTHLTNAELDRIDRAIRHKPVVYSIWKRAVEEGGPVTISTGVDGVMSVAAEAV